MCVCTFVFFCLAHREHFHFYCLLQHFKFPFLLVPHELEGALGHATAVAASGRPASQIASLDVGGGSFQVIAVYAVHDQQNFEPHINQVAFAIASCESKSCAADWNCADVPSKNNGFCTCERGRPSRITHV